MVLIKFIYYQSQLADGSHADISDMPASEQDFCSVWQGSCESWLVNVSISS